MATRAGLAAKRPAAVRSSSSVRKIELAVKALTTIQGGVGGAGNLRHTFLDGAHAGLLSARRYRGSICGCVLGGAGRAHVRMRYVHDGGACCGGVLERQNCVAEGWEATYGADMESIFLLRIGSDILANE